MEALKRYDEAVDRLCLSLFDNQTPESLDEEALHELRRLLKCASPLDDAMLVAIANDDARMQFLLGIDKLAQASPEENPWDMAMAVLCLQDVPGARQAWPQFAVGA